MFWHGSRGGKAEKLKRTFGQDSLMGRTWSESEFFFQVCLDDGWMVVLPAKLGGTEPEESSGFPS